METAPTIVISSLPCQLDCNVPAFPAPIHLPISELCDARGLGIWRSVALGIRRVIGPAQGLMLTYSDLPQSRGYRSLPLPDLDVDR